MEKDTWFTWASTLRRRNNTEVTMIQKTYEQLFEQAIKTIIFADKYTTDKFSIYLVPASVVGLMAFDRTVARDYIMRRMIKLRFNVSLPDPSNPFLLMFVWFDLPQLNLIQPAPDPPRSSSSYSQSHGHKSSKHSKRKDRRVTERALSEDSDSDDSDASSDSGSESSASSSSTKKQSHSSSSRSHKNTDKDDLYAFFRRVANSTKIVGR